MVEASGAETGGFDRSSGRIAVTLARLPDREQVAMEDRERSSPGTTLNATIPAMGLAFPVPDPWRTRGRSSPVSGESRSRRGRGAPERFPLATARRRAYLAGWRALPLSCAEQFRWPYSIPRELALSGPWSGYPAPTCASRSSGIKTRHGPGGPAASAQYPRARSTLPSGRAPDSWARIARITPRATAAGAAVLAMCGVIRMPGWAQNG